MVAAIKTLLERRGFDFAYFSHLELRGLPLQPIIIALAGAKTVNATELAPIPSCLEMIITTGGSPNTINV
jgi:hypothetical protein